MAFEGTGVSSAFAFAGVADGFCDDASLSWRADAVSSCDRARMKSAVRKMHAGPFFMTIAPGFDG
jgi:hypothetical protein